MTQIARRILGLDFDGKPIYAPKHAHSLLLSPAGGGKTTCGTVPWLQSLIADTSRAIVITDSKEGEIAAQCAAMCAKYGRKVAIVDEFGILGEDNPFRVSLNPFAGIMRAYLKRKSELIFAMDNACHALIEEPQNDQKNQYFRDWPRLKLEFGQLTLARRKLLTPGALWSLLANKELLLKAAEIEAEEGDETCQALANDILGMVDHEHFEMHRSAAVKSLKIYSAGSALHQTGVDADIDPEELVREKYIIFLVGPIRYMERLGPHYALLLQSFLEVLLSGHGNPITFILEELTNAPLQALISLLTTMRGYGGTCLMVAQSYSEIERKFGKLQAQTLLENAVIRQWFGFGSYEEAEKVSRAMGETLSLTSSLGTSSGNNDYSSTYGTAKEPLMPPEQLMSMPKGQMIGWAKDVGYFHGQMVAQNQLGPTCHDLAPNPQEGGILPPDPIVTLPVPGDLS